MFVRSLLMSSMIMAISIPFAQADHRDTRQGYTVYDRGFQSQKNWSKFGSNWAYNKYQRQLYRKLNRHNDRLVARAIIAGSYIGPRYSVVYPQPRVRTVYQAPIIVSSPSLLRGETQVRGNEREPVQFRFESNGECFLINRDDDENEILTRVPDINCQP